MSERCPWCDEPREPGPGPCPACGERPEVASRDPVVVAPAVRVVAWGGISLGALFVLAGIAVAGPAIVASAPGRLAGAVFALFMALVVAALHVVAGVDLLAGRRRGRALGIAAWSVTTAWFVIGAAAIALDPRDEPVATVAAIALTALPIAATWILVRIR